MCGFMNNALTFARWQLIPLWLGLGLYWGSAHAQLKPCEGLKNAEHTNRCLAIRDKDPKRCELIPKADQKYFCLAVVQHNKSACDRIKDPDNRNECHRTIR
jgi:hypothetical protein